MKKDFPFFKEDKLKLKSSFYEEKYGSDFSNIVPMKQKAIEP